MGTDKRITLPPLVGYTRVNVHKRVRLRLAVIAAARDLTIAAALSELVEREFQAVQEDRKGETGKV